MRNYSIKALIFDADRNRRTYSPVCFSLNSADWRALRSDIVHAIKQFRAMTARATAFIRFENTADRNRNAYFLAVWFDGDGAPRVGKIRRPGDVIMFDLSGLE